LHPQHTLWDYISILKPKETILLAFIGGCAGLIAAGGIPSLPIFCLLLVALILGSAGSNGLTNYLDRDIDARMIRTSDRALAARRIDPPQKALPLIIGLIVTGLVLAWILHPICFLIGLTGVTASGIWRKTISCTFLGMVASCSPVLIGWFAINPVFNLQIAVLSLLVVVWVPLHVWSVMIANREDYQSAGLNYFPLNISDRTIVRALLVLSIILYLTSISLYFIGDYGLIYLLSANIIGLLLIYASASLLTGTTTIRAWRVYKLSAYPYLGFVFLSMCVDILLVR
jgi:protoheme IX farnesyltransferase